MKKTLITLISALLISTAVNAADISYGISASVTKINASGTETESTEKTNASVSNTVAIGSIFVENNFGSYSLGLDWIPFSADISSKTKTRTEADITTSGSSSITNKAQAEIKNHLTLYGIVPFADKYFLKAGAVSVEVNSTESLGTGSKYGNKTVYGGTVGLGIQNDNLRIAIEYTDYESVSLTSSTNTDNKVSADLDTTAFKVSYTF